MRYFLVLLSIFSFSIVRSSNIEDIQILFPCGKIVSYAEGMACYRLNGNSIGSSYGYCALDGSYNPSFSTSSQKWDKNSGTKKYILNSKCYTVIGPYFDYALPFSCGWAAVSKNGKWSYVDKSGNMMTDFVLDAAYPFKNNQAHIVFRGKDYNIFANKDGLPDSLIDTGKVSSVCVKAKTIEQLYTEGQYEKTIEIGTKYYKEITTTENLSKDLTYDQLLYAVQISFLMSSAQNNLMAFFCGREQFQKLFDKYRSLTMPKRMSSESQHPELNLHNASKWFDNFFSRYNNTGNIKDIEKFIYVKNFKHATLGLEKWMKENSLEASDSPELLMTYFYLAELSNDFETANRLLITISEEYDKGRFKSIDNLSKACILSNIKKYYSSRNLFNEMLIKKVRSIDENERSYWLYNYALLYESSHDTINCKKWLNETIKYSKGNKVLQLEAMSELIMLYALQNSLNNELVEEYVNSEIAYDIDLFENTNKITLNTLWGYSQQRIQKVVSCLDLLNSNDFFSNVTRLVIFQQNIANDADNSLHKSVYDSQIPELLDKYNNYVSEKLRYKGINLFSRADKYTQEYSKALDLYSKEKEIKDNILLQQKHFIDKNIYLSPFMKTNDTEVIINILEYKNFKNDLFQYGVLCYRGDGSDVSFTPLGIYDEFKDSTFWDQVLPKINIRSNDRCYIYLGKLDTKGLEYSESKLLKEKPYFKYDIHRVSSVLNIGSSTDLSSTSTISLFGGLEYGDSLIAVNRGSVGNGYLTYSKEEVDRIESIAKPKWTVTKLTDSDGTIDAFIEQTSKKVDIVHLATHGYQASNEVSNMEDYFIQDRFNYYRQNTDIQDKEWLMNSTGLFLSLNPNDSTNVLYSNFVSGLNLNKTKLVVLSACNTISGQNTDDQVETVGLTTAFLMAGAKNIVTSLWNVNDEETAEFMTIFYGYLIKDGNIHNSFKRSIMEMYHRYPNNKEYWQAFVLVEKA